MSFKTLRKRIALVATVSLGFGLLSVAPASAAAMAAISNVSMTALATTDTTMNLVSSGSLGTRYSEVTVYTENTSVLATDLSLTVTGTYTAGTASTYDV